MCYAVHSATSCAEAHIPDEPAVVERMHEQRLEAVGEEEVV